MAPARSRLLIVYNADSGIVSAVKDMIHKIPSPQTYPCSLCALDHGWLAMHGRWRRFLASLPHETVFHHRDDFAEAYPGMNLQLPAILLAAGGGKPEVIVSAAELDAMPDLEALIAVLKARLTPELAG